MIEAEVLHDDYVGYGTLIPRILLVIEAVSRANDLCTTINKSQEQTLKKVNICLTRDVQGQLHAASSRVTVAEIVLYTFATNSSNLQYVCNVVYDEALR